MNNKLKILVTLLSISSLSGCNKSHTHIYEEIIKDEYIAHIVDCENPLTYYKSCACGKKSNETFSVGEALGHDVNPKNCFQDEQCKRCGKTIYTKANECFVGEPSIKTVDEYLAFQDNSLLSLLMANVARFEKHTFNYISTDLKGNSIVLSGAITIPYTNEGAYFKGFVIDNRPTIVDKSEAPSECWTKTAVTTALGLIVFEFDLLGFGTTVDRVSSYHCNHLTVRNTVDGIKSAFNLLNNELNIKRNNKPIFNVGYSQGGYDALALMRYLETEATAEEKALIPISKTFAGSGAYDLKLMTLNSLSNPDFAAPEYLLMGLLTTYEYHKEYYGSLKLEDFLTEYGLSFVEPVNAKNKAKVDELKAKTKPNGDKMYQTPSDFFSASFLNAEGSYLEAMNNACANENLLDGKWMPSGELMMFYSESDELVTPECSKKAEEMFASLKNVKFNKVNKVNHEDGGTDFYALVIANLLTLI